MQVEPRIGGIEFPKQPVMRLSGVLYRPDDIVFRGDYGSA